MQTPAPFSTFTDAQLADAIQNTRQLLWNASQMNNTGGVFRLQRALDNAIDEKYRRAATRCSAPKGSPGYDTARAIALLPRG